MLAQARRNPGRQRTMHTLVFRSCDVILEVDDARLIEDVCFDLEKAEKKLISARRQLVNVRERAAEEIRKLTAKLGAAVDAARRSMKGGPR